jgi:hypothetical protein
MPTAEPVGQSCGGIHYSVANALVLANGVQGFPSLIKSLILLGFVGCGSRI